MKTSLSILAIIAVTVVIVRTIPRAEAATALTPVGHRAYDPTLATKEVEFNLARVKRDPSGAIGWKQLATAYLNAGREKDSEELAKKAEAAARKSLSLRTSRNSSAAVILSEALLEQHRFNDALVACQKSLELEPGNDFAERTLTDIYFEIGRYEEARQLIGKHPEWSKDPSGLSMMARQSELVGKPEVAMVQLQQATDIAESRPDFADTTVSWFHTKLGDILARNGQLAKAESHYLTALKQNPGSWKAMASMARLKAMQQDHKGVLMFGEKLNAIAPMTDVVGLMEDAAKAIGDKTGAAKYADQVLEMNKSSVDAGTDPENELDETRGHTHDRMFSVYLADRNSKLALAQHAATHDLANRKDIFAYDTYAWATYKLATSVANDSKSNYRLIEAKQCIDKALALGTKNATIFFHAGMIELALNNKLIAKSHLQEALRINPNFNPAQADEARKELSNL